MTRSLLQFKLILTTIALISLSLFFLASTSHATIVGAQSTGEDLAGGRILVTFAQQGLKAAPIFAGGPGQGTASLPGLFTFSVTGDTFLADWQLTNNTTFDTIQVVEFDLSGTSSQPEPNGPIFSPGVLFDNNSTPSTPDSFAGRLGAVQTNVSPPTIINSFEVTPWTDSMNEGDEFVGEVIEYREFGPLMTSIWRDDTDIVGISTDNELPEPTSALLLLIAVVGVSSFNRQRR